MKSSLLYADGKIVYGCAPKAQEILTHFNNKILHKIIARGNTGKTNIKIVKSSLLYADSKILYVQGVFLMVVLFDLICCLYFSPNFIHRPLIFFVRFCAIEWGSDHNSSIDTSRVIGQCVNGLILKKMIFNDFWRKFRFFEFSNKT